MGKKLYSKPLFSKKPMQSTPRKPKIPKERYKPEDPLKLPVRPRPEEKKPARRNPNPIVRKKKDITVTTEQPSPPVAKNAFGKPYPISTPISVIKKISKPANRTEKKIKRVEKKYTTATKEYQAKTGNAPYEAFTSGSRAGKKVRRISERLGKLYKKPLFAKKPRVGPGRRTAGESVKYGLKAILAAGAVVGTMLGGKKLVEGIKKKVGEHRLEKFGEQGVGTSYKARQFRKKFRKNN